MVRFQSIILYQSFCYDYFLSIISFHSIVWVQSIVLVQSVHQSINDSIVSVFIQSGRHDMESEITDKMFSFYSQGVAFILVLGVSLGVVVGCSLLAVTVCFYKKSVVTMTTLSSLSLLSNDVELSKLSSLLVPKRIKNIFTTFLIITSEIFKR